MPLHRSQSASQSVYRFFSTLIAADFTTCAAFSQSFLLNAAETESLMLGLASTSSCPLSLFARVTQTPWARHSSTISCRRRSSLSISNSGTSRGWTESGLLGLPAEVWGLRNVKDGGETRMWIMGLARCEDTVMQSTRSRIVRTARTFSCSVLRMDGVLRRMLMPSLALTARRAGKAAENTNEVPLIRCV